MRHAILGAAAVLAAASFSAPASAGCLKGAVVGGIAGHFVGHGVAGAAAGCAIGHVRSKHRRDAETTGSIDHGRGRPDYPNYNRGYDQGRSY
jgi:hypothetical protein